MIKWNNVAADPPPEYEVVLGCDYNVNDPKASRFEVGEMWYSEANKEWTCVNDGGPIRATHWLPLSELINSLSRRFK